MGNRNFDSEVEYLSRYNVQKGPELYKTGSGKGDGVKTAGL